MFATCSNMDIISSLSLLFVWLKKKFLELLCLCTQLCSEVAVSSLSSAVWCFYNLLHNLEQVCRQIADVNCIIKDNDYDKDMINDMDNRAGPRLKSPLYTSAAVGPGVEVYFHPCSLNTGGSVTTWLAADHATVISAVPSTIGKDIKCLYVCVSPCIRKTTERMTEKKCLLNFALFTEGAWWTVASVTAGGTWLVDSVQRFSRVFSVPRWITTNTRLKMPLDIQWITLHCRWGHRLGVWFSATHEFTCQDRLMVKVHQTVEAAASLWGCCHKDQHEGWRLSCLLQCVYSISLATFYLGQWITLSNLSLRRLPRRSQSVQLCLRDLCVPTLLTEGLISLCLSAVLYTLCSLGFRLSYDLNRKYVVLTPQRLSLWGDRKRCTCFEAEFECRTYNYHCS